MDILKLLKIDENSRIPKYQQIVDSIIYNISIESLTIEQKLPSINEFSEEFYLSRDTVEKAYNILKKRNIIASIRGKGYYINQNQLITKKNVLFLLNKLSSYKLKIYDSFLKLMGPGANVELDIYHCEESLFLNILEKHKYSYDYYVIMPHFVDSKLQHISSTPDVLKAISNIPIEKLLIMDNLNFLNNIHAKAVYQDFENDIYDALKEGLYKIKNYSKIILVYPEKIVYPYPKRILRGFKKFCLEFCLDFEILNEVYEDMILKKGDLFITIEESDLVNLIKQIKEDEYVIGKDIGIISYNDTPLKELLGITVISTDFKAMGEIAAKLITSKELLQVKTPFNFIDRESV